MLVAIIYIVPWIIIILLAGPKLIRRFNLFKNADKKEKHEIINNLKKKYEKSTKFNKPISDLMKIRPIIISQILSIWRVVFLLYALPIAALRMSLISIWGVEITWRLPVNLYEIWNVLFLITSYYYSYDGSPFFGFVIAIIVGICTFYMILSEFETGDKGTLHILNRPINKLHFKDLIEEGLIIVASFAAAFYSINIIYPETFSSKLTILDSIYFSIITVTTVGYGDINPVSNLGKILVITEILFGLFYMLIVVSIFLSVFMKRHSEEQKNKEL